MKPRDFYKLVIIKKEARGGDIRPMCLRKKYTAEKNKI